MTSSAIAWPLLIAALTPAGTRADRFDLRTFFAITHLPSWKDIEQCVERIELHAETLQFFPAILVELLPGGEMFEFALPLKNSGHSLLPVCVAVQIAVKSGEARNHLVGDDAIGFGSFRRELVESGHGLDQDRRLTIARPPTVDILPLIIPHRMTRDTGQDVDFQLDRHPAQSICKAFRP